MEDAGVAVISKPAPMAGWTSMNLAKGVTQELAVRQAIAHAVDASAIVSEFLEGHGAVSRGGARGLATLQRRDPARRVRTRAGRSDPRRGRLDTGR
jgi:hypothetical protein